MDPAPAALDVRRVSVPTRVVAGIGAEVDHTEVVGWYAGAMAELAPSA